MAHFAPLSLPLRSLLFSSSLIQVFFPISLSLSLFLSLSFNFRIPQALSLLLFVSLLNLSFSLCVTSFLSISHLSHLSFNLKFLFLDPSIMFSSFLILHHLSSSLFSLYLPSPESTLSLPLSFNLIPDSELDAPIIFTHLFGSYFFLSCCLFPPFLHLSLSLSHTLSCFYSLLLNGSETDVERIPISLEATPPTTTTATPPGQPKEILPTQIFFVGLRKTFWFYEDLGLSLEWPDGAFVAFIS